MSDMTSAARAPELPADRQRCARTGTRHRRARIGGRGPATPTAPAILAPKRGCGREDPLLCRRPVGLMDVQSRLLTN